MFSVIPVLDLMRGQVVAAHKGERSRYQPLRSSLSADSEPQQVIEGLLRLHDFRTFYIADLDAITDGEPQSAIIRALKAHFPAVGFWIDAGIRNLSEYHASQALGLGRMVIGSETFSDIGQPSLPHDSILSLDFLNEQPLGDGRLCTMPECWPQQLIVLSLGKVGSMAGPDLERLRHVQEQAPQAAIIAGGGVRHAADLETLRAMKLSGALVGSALYQGHISSAELKALGMHI